MPQALLALALLMTVAWAKDDPDGTAAADRRRAALAAAACNKDSPRLLVKKPAKRSHDKHSETDSDNDDSGGAVELPRNKDCAKTLSSLPDNSDVALRPEPDPSNPSGPLTEQQISAAFQTSRKLGALSAKLDETAQKLNLSGLDGFAQGRSLFDNDRSEGVAPEPQQDQRQELVKALVAELKSAPAGTAEAVPPPPKEPPPQKGLKTNAPPSPGPAGFASQTSPHSDAGTYPYYDPRGWTGSSPAPAPMIPAPNLMGTPVEQYGRLTPMDRNHTSGPVWAPFYAKFKQCRPDCEPASFNIWRNDPGSCHSVGAAIDFFSMKCGGVVHTALQNGQVAELVSCMRSNEKGPPMFAIWHQCFKNCSPPNQTNYHMDHSHFSIGCGWGRK